jgi:hypothetical protein
MTPTRKSRIHNLHAAIESDVDALQEANEIATKLLRCIDIVAMEQEGERLIDDAVAAAIGSLDEKMDFVTPMNDEGVWRTAAVTRCLISFEQHPTTTPPTAPMEKGWRRAGTRKPGYAMKSALSKTPPF